MAKHRAHPEYSSSLWWPGFLDAWQFSFDVNLWKTQGFGHRGLYSYTLILFLSSPDNGKNVSCCPSTSCLMSTWPIFCLFVSNRNLVRFRYSLIPSANTVCLFLDVQFALMICQLLVLIYCMCPRINGYLDHSNGHFTKWSSLNQSNTHPLIQWPKPPMSCFSFLQMNVLSDRESLPPESSFYHRFVHVVSHKPLPRV